MKVVDMKNHNLWSRRKFSKAAVSAQLLFGSGLMNIAVGCTRNETTTALSNESNRTILKFVMDEIIPGTDTMPAASEIGGIEYIFKVLNKYHDIKPSFMQILIDINQESKLSNNADFINLEKHSRIDLLKQYENSQPERFQVLVNFVYESYYINEEIWKLIEYVPYPTLSSGPEMDPFDPSLLHRVKNIPPFYQEISN